MPAASFGRALARRNYRPFLFGEGTVTLWRPLVVGCGLLLATVFFLDLLATTR